MIPYGPIFDKSGLPSPECMVIVDSGFSFTHVIPIMGGTVVWEAVKRLVAPLYKRKQAYIL